MARRALFKVGDKVELVTTGGYGSSHNNTISIGDKGIIKKVYKYGVDVKTENYCEDLYYYFDEIKNLTFQKEEQK